MWETFACTLYLGLGSLALSVALFILGALIGARTYRNIYRRKEASEQHAK